MIDPSGARDSEASNVTSSPTVGPCGEYVNAALGSLSTVMIGVVVGPSEPPSSEPPSSEPPDDPDGGSPVSPEASPASPFPSSSRTISIEAGPVTVNSRS